MNKNLIVYIENEEYKSVVTLLINSKVSFEDLIVKDNKIYFKINSKDYKLLNQKMSIKKYKYLGKIRLIYFIRKNKILLISFLISLIVIKVLSNVIFSVDIISDNETLKEEIKDSLYEENIKPYKFVKKDKEINEIKEKILKKNEESLEWIEMERIGTKYKVSLTPRVIKKEVEENAITSIVAKKEGMIKYIVNTSGVRVKEVNDIVKKGEELISGNIYKDEKIIDQVKSKGKVYAEVWYKTDITVPYKHVIYEKTGEVVNHIYLDIFNHKFTLMGKFETNNSMNSEKVIVDKPYLPFKIINERKELYQYKEVNLSKEEAKNEAIKRSDKSIYDKLDVEEYIIDKKVLKINDYSSKIEVEVFYRVYEDIGEEIVIEKIVEGEIENG